MRKQTGGELFLALTQQALTTLEHSLTCQPTNACPLTSLTYLVDCTGKRNPGPLSPAEGHTPLSNLCLVSSRQDLKEQTPSG